MATLGSREPDPIDRQHGVSYYLQLKAILEDFIDKDHLKPGDPIPSEAELSRTYLLSRTAIRNALNQLQLEGRVHRVRGKRTVVSRRIPWDIQLEQKTDYRSFAEPSRLREALENTVVLGGPETMQALHL